MSKICKDCWTGEHKMSVAQWCGCCAAGHGNGEDMSVVVYDPSVHGEDDVRRNRVREWLESNGLNTQHVSINGAIRVEGSHIHFLGYTLDMAGNRVVSQDPKTVGAPILAGMTGRLKIEWMEPDNG